MNEADWLNSTDPQAMLTFLRGSGKLTERKARLFAVACCRRIWHLLADESSRAAVEVGERYADGLASVAELRAAAQNSGSGLLAPAEADSCHSTAFAAATAASMRAIEAGTWSEAVRNPAWESVQAAEHAAQAALLRCISSDPFSARPAIPAAVLGWSDGCVVKLAAGIYDGRDFSSERMGVLADALEDAGITDPDILGHLRQQGAVHVRGCFVVDLLLGKE